MTVVVDINVVLDVFQERKPHYDDSAAVLGLISKGRLTGICPAHGLTTIYYMMARHEDRVRAMVVIDQLLAHFTIVGLEHAGWVRARLLGFNDFEDSAIAQVAVETNVSWIITRNTSHFKTSPVPAITPKAFLKRFFLKSGTP
jgi:predicted nucleic acid-binding protein